MRTLLSKITSLTLPLYITLAVVLFFIINSISNTFFYNWRIDLTENNLYTLSQGTQALLKKIDDPITIKFFFSNKLANGYPQLKTYASRVKGMLEQLVHYSNGQIILQSIDPEPFSEDEDLAVSLGMKGVPIDSGGESVYFGIAINNSVDAIQSIPFLQLDKEKFLEYDLIRMISDLAQPRGTVVGVLSSIPMQAPMHNTHIPKMEENDMAASWVILQQIRQLFEVKILDTALTSIPNGVNVLMVVYPEALDKKTLYAIEQFALAGGHLILFADPLAEAYLPPASMAAGADASKEPLQAVHKMLSAWGVDFPEGLVVADRNAARWVTNPLAADEGEVTLSQPTSLSLKPERFNQEDIITADLQSLTFSTAGTLLPIAGSTTTVTPLITSSGQSMLVDKQHILQAGDLSETVGNYKEGNKNYFLAARITGKAMSVFPEYGAGNGKDSTPSHLTASTLPLQVVVVADTDVLQDKNWVKRQNFMGYLVYNSFSDNGALVINALDHLSGSPELIQLRTRASTLRGFDVVERIRHKAEEKYLEKEKALKAELRNTETALAELQKQEGKSSASYNIKGQEEIERFKGQMLLIRKELRQVRHELDKDISHLGNVLKVIDILLVPLCVIISAIGVFWYRRARSPGQEHV